MPTSGSLVILSSCYLVSAQEYFPYVYNNIIIIIVIQGVGRREYLVVSLLPKFWVMYCLPQPCEYMIDVPQKLNDIKMW